MTKNKEIIKNITSKEVAKTVERNAARIKKRAMLKESRKIALAVLMKLDELEWSQKDLADKMGVSKQQVNKIVKGKENLTLQSMVSIQDILGLPILASYFAQNVLVQKEAKTEEISKKMDYQIPFSVEKNYEKKEVEVKSRKKRYSRANSTSTSDSTLYIA
jgi:transcriptional regulator with XRE-family HTH domain